MFGCPSLSAATNIQYETPHRTVFEYCIIQPFPAVNLSTILIKDDNHLQTPHTFLSASPGLQMCGDASSARHQVGGRLELNPRAPLAPAPLLCQALVAGQRASLGQEVIVISLIEGKCVVHCDFFYLDKQIPI